MTTFPAPIVTRHLPEQPVPGKRLGRHVHHDPKSRLFAASSTQPVFTALHKRRVPIYDQGDTGSCTGNAIAGSLSTAPFVHRFHESTAVKIYSAATRIDPFEGQFPPDDNGSDGLSVCKIALQNGWIRSYQHAFDINAALAALSIGPVIVGMDWLDGMDNPDSQGRVRYTGSSRGGHEMEFLGIDIVAREVRFAQSWGIGWGDHGYGVMSWADFELALSNQGDCTIPVR